MHPDGTANESAAEGYVGPVVIPHAEERSSGITNLHNFSCLVPKHGGFKDGADAELFGRVGDLRVLAALARVSAVVAR
jgi:hypothetical protein